MVLCWLVSLAAVIWMSCRGSVAWHPKDGCKGDYMLIWAQWFCYLCILHPWAQCSESVKSRVPSKWFVSKNQDFLVAREQKLGCRGHRDLPLNSQEYCLLTNSLWQPSQPPLLTQPSPAPLLTQSTNHFYHGLMLISLPCSLIWMSRRGSIAWHPKNSCKGDYMLIWAQWFCYLCVLRPWHIKIPKDAK